MDSTCSLAPETEARRNAFLLFTPELIVNRLLAKKEESRPPFDKSKLSFLQFATRTIILFLTGSWAYIQSIESIGTTPWLEWLCLTGRHVSTWGSLAQGQDSYLLAWGTELTKRLEQGITEVFLFTTKLVMRTYVMTLISEMGLSSRLSSQQASSTVNDPSADPSTEKWRSIIHGKRERISASHSRWINLVAFWFAFFLFLFQKSSR